MNSTSSFGVSQISLQFDLNRDIDGATQDVQAAINAARGQLPTSLPNNPTYRKVNPSETPILILALTSKTLTPSALYDIADTTIAQRLSQVAGVAEVPQDGAGGDVEDVERGVPGEHGLVLAGAGHRGGQAIGGGLHDHEGLAVAAQLALKNHKVVAGSARGVEMAEEEEEDFFFFFLPVRLTGLLLPDEPNLPASCSSISSWLNVVALFEGPWYFFALCLFIFKNLCSCLLTLSFENLSGLLNSTLLFLEQFWS